MTAIDIILPYFNGSKFIEAQLKSIYQNELIDIEVRLILVNDASKEEETRFLMGLLPQNHLYIENEKNLGVIKSVEKGLKAATAPYIMLCDQDDVWLPHKIKSSLKKIKEIEKGEPSLVYTDLKIVDKDLKLKYSSMHDFYKHNHEAVFPSILFHNIVTGCTVIMNRQLLSIALPFPERITMHDHWLAICAVFAGNIACLEEVTMLYRQHGQNQVGAPTENLFTKLMNFKRVIPKFKLHIRMKAEMAEELAKRFEAIGLVEKAEFMNTVVRSIKNKNIYNLLKMKVIRGSVGRVLGVSSLLMLIKSDEQ